MTQDTKKFFNICSKHANSFNWLSPFQQLAKFVQKLVEFFQKLAEFFQKLADFFFSGWKNWAGHGNTASGSHTYNI